jgi:hypothetical protein
MELEEKLEIIQELHSLAGKIFQSKDLTSVLRVMAMGFCSLSGSSFTAGEVKVI